ncbi:MAG: Holliday junction branch migration protein RuvA [Clostridia bacterium]|nr:Holliday junction branch migration protein RuvA [Clostridia bacterium]
MFDYIAGKLVSLSANQCVVETGGIGWNFVISSKTAARLSGSEEAKLFTHLSLGSSDRPALFLYGFSSVAERETFRNLIEVSGIGPKVAISVLSALSPEELAMCVLSGDAKALTAAQGIGMKGAQKIILELKDKVSKSTALSASAPAAPVRKEGISDLTEAVNALVVLGYSPQVAASAVNAVAERAKNLQDLIRLALKSMGE